MYNRSNLHFIERYSKPKGLKFVGSGSWEYRTDLGLQTISTARVLPILMEGSLNIGAPNINPLNYRDHFASKYNTQQKGEFGYHVVMLIPSEVMKQFEAITTMNMRGETKTLSQSLEDISAEHVGLNIPDSLQAEILRYTSIYWGPADRPMGYDLDEVFSGDRFREIMSSLDKEGYEGGEGKSIYHKL